MDLSLSEEQEAVRDALARFLDKASSAEQVRAAEPLGWDPAVWAGLVRMGVPTMGVAEHAGGQGAALADLAVVAAACGARLAAAPVVETMVAARLLARFPDAGAPWLAHLVAGTSPVTLALRPARGRRATLVPGAAVAGAVIALDGDELVVVGSHAAAGPDDRRAPANLGSAPLADVDLDRPADRSVLAVGTAARAALSVALDEWRALTAQWLVGLGRAALDLGVQYAKDRHQFGVPIGSFQAVQHRLADLRTDLDGAALLADKALWALDVGDAAASTFPSMAFAFAGTTAQEVAAAALHYHGGYGFMEEYDVQLYFRRAKAARLVLGDPRRELQHLADRMFSPSARANPAGARADDGRSEPQPRSGIDFRLGPEVEAFRAEVRSFLAEHVTDEVIEAAHRTGTIHDWGLHRKMAAQGWLSAGWPVEYGGQGRSPLEMNALTEEMYLAGAPVDGLGVAALVAHTLLIDGTDWQKQTIIPEILAGDALCCLGYSEPDAGSDVAACATRAVRDGDQWVVNGQKMFTTLAHEARYVFLLTRTNADLAKHRGLTMFIVPMDTPGIEVTPVHTMGGERTNITFYTDARVPDRYRVGTVDGGWQVMLTALVFERNSSWYGEQVRLLDHAVRWAQATLDDGGRPFIDDPLVRDRLARAAIGNEVSNLLGWRAAWMASNGELPGVEGTMAKLFTTEHYQRTAGDLIDLLGAEGLRRHGEPGAAADGWIEAIYRHAQVTTIYGGTSEVLRGIIAERALGLPRSR
ncbi:MAG: uncharacterized protein JWN46_599 [Acidimicrobiales bacterium]|nr:uncharacterized protein [Acidimicrobiales bacterium]